MASNGSSSKGKGKGKGKRKGKPPSLTTDPATSTSSEEQLLNNVLEGGCTFEKLPPQSKNIVRIFVSSTFSDTKEERNAFMQKVYPKLADLCRQKYGLEFQVVDMRWGVPEQASENHSTTELCLNEIHKCQEVSAGPNFVAILGNKYGYRPIPNEIAKEEFELLRSTEHAMADEGWATVSTWYRLDTNCQPPVYILQPIGDMLPDYNNTENQELRKKASSEWNKVENILTQCLRRSAGSAFDAKSITENQKHKYFMSVTENEVKHGILDNAEAQKSCLCIIRQIPDITSHLTETKAPKFIDIDTNKRSIDDEAETFLKTLRNKKIKESLPADNMSSFDVDWEISGAKVSLDNISKDVSDNENVKNHEHYLNMLCSEYLQKLESLIISAGDKQIKLYDEVNNEVLQHWYFAKERCQVFEGREEIIQQAKKYISIKTNHPLVIYGRSGCGKTSVIAKLVQLISHQISIKGQTAKVPLRFCFRFLGTTPLTSNIQQVLVSLCKQLSSSCDIKWEEPDKYPELVQSFHNLLETVSKKFRILLILDSIDQLLPAYDAYKLGWIPKVLPKNIKIILSTLDEGYPIIETLQNTYSTSQTAFIEISPLPKEVGMKIIKAWLHKSRRIVSDPQENLIQQTLEICGLPLFARIMFDQVRKWRSYETYTLEDLETTIQGAINKLFEQMETKFGLILVKHSLSYLTSSRYGLSEVELEHIMSLDDDLLDEVFRYWRPPIRRIPALLWTRIRNEIDSYIVERSADGVLVLYWYHRQFITASKQRYLKQHDFVKSIHSVMVEYFSGTWGGGKCKPFTYGEFQRKRFGLAVPEAEEDRKVPLQPYLIDTDMSADGNKRFNNRKVTELPHHLLHIGDMNGLKEKVFFNLHWIYAKLKGSSIQALIQELEFFIESNRSIRTDVAYKILFATLQLVRPYLMKYPESLPYELSGRLAKYIDKFPVFRLLIKACDRQKIPLCPLIPMYTCFETAQLGLKQNLTTSQSEPIHEGGCICCTLDFKTMYSITYNESGLPYLSTWDVDNGSRTQRVLLEKGNRSHDSFDSYFQCLLHKDENHIVALYRKKYFRYDGPGKHKYTNNGYIDVIDINTSAVIRTFEHNLYNRDFHNCVNFMKGDWIAVWFGVKVPLLHLFENIRHRHSRPHMITNDCTKAINKCSQRAPTRYYVGDDKTTASTRTKSVQVKMLNTDNAKDTLGELEESENAQGIGVSHSDKVVILGAGSGELSIFKLRHLGNKKSIKSRSKLHLPRNDRVKTKMILDNQASDDSDSNSDEESAKPRMKVANKVRMTIIVSPDDRFIISVHQNLLVWEAFLWSLQKREFIARIADDNPLHYKYPQFTNDGNFVVMAEEKQVKIVSSVNGQLVKTYNVNGEIRDWCVSQSENQAAVMLSREIIFLDIDAKHNVATADVKAKDQKDKMCLLKRERFSSMNIVTPLYAASTPSGLEVEERPDPAELLSRGLLTSAQKGDRVTLDVLNTEDGKGLVELFTRVQIVDVKNETVRYTPLKGDMFFQQPKDSDDRGSTHELYNATTLPMPHPLSVGDKIVGGNGRVRLRVGDEDNNLQVMNVASFVTLKTIEDGTAKLQFGISMFRETLKTVSRNYLVMLKRSTNEEERVNVYDCAKGKLLISHPLAGGVKLVAIPSDESRLLVITKDLVLHIFSGQNFIHGQGRRLLTKTKGIDDTVDVKDITTFPMATDVILVRYGENNTTSSHGYIYQRINVVTSTLSPLVKAKLPFEDISSDACMAVDAQLVLHDLEKGTIQQKIPYVNSSVNMRVQARISEDRKYIAFVDKVDDTLHVTKLVEQKYQPWVTCKAHVPQLPPYGGFHFRQQGRVISIKSEKDMVLLTIRDPENPNDKKLDYPNELQRSITLLPTTDEPMSKTLVSPVPAGRVLSAKAVLPDKPVISESPNLVKSEPKVEEHQRTQAQSDVVVEDFMTYLSSVSNQQASAVSDD